MIKKRPVIYASIGHGNEPLLLFLNLAKRLNAPLTKIFGCEPCCIVPHFTHDPAYASRQIRFIKEYDFSSNIKLDPDLGNLYQPLLFQSNGPAGFVKNLENIITGQEKIQHQIKKHIQNTYGSIDLEINTGSRVSVGEHAYFAFPVMLSRLLSSIIKTPALHSEFNLTIIDKALKAISPMEKNFDRVFIPSYHTLLAFDNIHPSDTNEIPTPPLKELPTKSVQDIPEQSLYCMFSGTDADNIAIFQRAKTYESEGYHIITSPWDPRGISIPSSWLRAVLCNISTNQNLKAVLGRAGWGTLWDCQVAQKPFLHMPYSYGDDPEIFFNVRTLEEYPIAEATNNQLLQFKTLNGIDYVVEKIIDNLNTSA